MKPPPINVPMDSSLPHNNESRVNPQPNESVVDAQKNTDDFGDTISSKARLMTALLNRCLVRLDKDGLNGLEDFNLRVGFSPDTAHLAAWLAQQSILETILNRCPSLFFLRNSRGDTPLHVAARAGQLRIVKYLVENCKSRDVQRDGGVEVAVPYLEMKNKKGNTALHEALEFDSENVAQFLVERDPKLSFSVVNKVGKSPAYLAAEACRLSLLKKMLESLDDNHNLSEWRVMTPLHAAILTKSKDTVDCILELKPQLIRATDKKGRNPVHYAASIGYYYGLSGFLTKDSLAAFLPDDDGLYPIHMAASSGHIHIIKLLLDFCLLLWALHSNEGQNILHLAAQSGKVNVVEYILKRGMFASLINSVDGKGNTPLHLATMGRHFKVVRAFSKDSRVNMNITNNDNLTALDIAEEHIVIGATFRRLLTLTALRIANAPRAPSSLNIFNDKLDDKLDDKQLVDNDGQRSVNGNDKLDDKQLVDNDSQRPVNGNGERSVNGNGLRTTDEFYKDRVNTLLLTSTLVATVTFAAGFTIPGGLNSSGGHDQGIATMLTKNMFKAFVICDAISLFCSILAVISLIWAQVADVLLMRFIFGFTLPLLGISLSMMTIAFTAGLYIVISQIHWLATLVLIMATIFLICTIALFLPLCMPMQSRHRFFQSFIYHLLYLLNHAAVGNSDSGIIGDNDITAYGVKNTSNAESKLLQRFKVGFIGVEMSYTV